MKFLIVFAICFAAGLLYDWLKKPKCAHCGSRDGSDGAYTRGRNYLCQQAAGDSGHYCRKCEQITWRQPYEDYVAGCPKWVKPYSHERARTGRKEPK